MVLQEDNKRFSHKLYIHSHMSTTECRQADVKGTNCSKNVLRMFGLVEGLPRLFHRSKSIYWRSLRADLSNSSRLSNYRTISTSPEERERKLQKMFPKVFRLKAFLFSSTDLPWEGTKGSLVTSG